MHGAVHGVAVALMLAAVLLLAVAGSYRVLCVGADGHVGIEPVTSDCCGSESPDAGDRDDCGDCVDLVVEGDASRVDRGPATDLPGPDAVDGSTTCAAFDVMRLPRCALARPEPGVPRATLDALRTVVFRV